MLGLVENKRVVIVGIPGVGKTTLVTKVVDKLNNDTKAYGEDYTEENTRNNQLIYPYFMITSVSKSSKNIKIECFQLHKLQATFNPGLGSLSRRSELGINGIEIIETESSNELLGYEVLGLFNPNGHFTLEDVAYFEQIVTPELGETEIDVNYMTSYQKRNANLNGDDSIDVLDVVEMVETYIDYKNIFGTYLFWDSIYETPDIDVNDTIVNMVDTMTRYVFPPRMDFLTNDTISPFTMFVFEFEHSLTKKDLTDIWQNLPPDIGTSFKTSTVSMSNLNFISEDALVTDPLPSIKDLRWMVFKVKQRAEKNYFDKIKRTVQGKAGLMEFTPIEGSLDYVPPYSFNWPYDYFSLIEMTQIGVDVTLEGSEVIEIPETTSDPVEEFVNKSIPTGEAESSDAGAGTAGAPDEGSAGDGFFDTSIPLPGGK